jgi:hypothetical protein
MGGNLFKDQSRRISSEEFKSLSLEIINSVPDVTRPKIIKSYKNKESFGDIDIIYDNLYSQELLNYIKDQNYQLKSNGSVKSILFKNVQVDFIGVKPDEYNFAFNYFSYNDLGNLIGRIAHSFGFKFGHNGLFYVLRDRDNPTRVINEIVVTQDYNKALNFINYPSIDRIEFNELEDIFDFVMDNQFARPEIFLLENRNHISRVRDRKRKTYMQFLDYIKTKDYHDRLIPDRSYQLNKAFLKFPEFNIRYNVATVNYERYKARHEKFNGNIVREISGLDGKELGQLMIKLKSSITDEYLDITSKGDVISRIKQIISMDDLLDLSRSF